ncbi:hypothetical protein OG239_12880 [Streptomyces sp. NBC_00868]|uniref:hypothetical protein n=1 Tax=unclassified Streptomyces TaxID=2593676 RepID=UPI00324D4480|nr:hypothetical protein OG239_12880 [Streptomyces sp. NBC_00868]
MATLAGPWFMLGEPAFDGAERGRQGVGSRACGQLPLFGLPVCLDGPLGLGAARPAHAAPGRRGDAYDFVDDDPLVHVAAP